MLEEREVLAENQRQSRVLVDRIGMARTRKLLRRAQAEMERRLQEAVSRGADFTAIQLRQSIEQIRHVTTMVQGGLKKIVLDAGEVAAEQGGENVVQYLRAADKRFQKAMKVGNVPLQLEEASLIDAAHAGTQASILRRLGNDPTHPHRPGILQRYGMETVAHFEDILQQGLVARTPWAEMRTRMQEASPFLKGKPSWWADRIVRTELMGVTNRAHSEAIKESNNQLGDMVQILSATFDSRTGSDSYAVHGQIRRPGEPFESWFGLYMHPPNRSNDREVIVPHRIRWPIPPYLAWKNAAQIIRRWKFEGRKGAPPSRPNMTTVPLSEFGNPKSAERRDRG